MDKIESKIKEDMDAKRMSLVAGKRKTDDTSVRFGDGKVNYKNFTYIYIKYRPINYDCMLLEA